MKNYKDFARAYIGSSDVASLTLRAPSAAYVLTFGEDGDYYAYIVEGEAEIGEHYRLAFECKHWLWVYDDDGRRYRAEGRNAAIKVYRAGLKGCIIQVLTED